MSVSQHSKSQAVFPPALTWKSFIELSPVQSSQVLEWRNHPKVRCWMRNQSEIPEKEHLQFIENLRVSEDQQYFMLSLGDTAIAVADFYAIDATKATCFYGYYLNPELLGASYGLLLEYWVAEYAFFHLQMSEIRAETKPENRSANELHDFFGFQTSGLNSHGLLEATLSRKTWFKKRTDIQPMISRF